MRRRDLDARVRREIVRAGGDPPDGNEAEELRSAIESFIKELDLEHTIHQLRIAVPRRRWADRLESVIVEGLRDILERVDARDSLASAMRRDLQKEGA